MWPYLNRLYRDLRLMVTKALVDSVDDSAVIQRLKLKLLDSEILENVEHIQQYGFTSIPPQDSEIVAVEVGASRDHVLAVASTHSKSRPVGSQVGEVSVWCQHGQRMYHKSDGSTVITATSGLVKIEASNGSVEINNGAITVSGDMTINGNLTVTGNVTTQTGSVQGFEVMVIKGGLLYTLSAHTHPNHGMPPTPGT